MFDDDVEIKSEPRVHSDASKDKVECRFKDQSVLKQILTCSAGIDADTITLKAKKDSLSYIGIEQNHVAMLFWELNADAFDFYKMETTNEEASFEISLSLDLLQKVLKICKPKDQIHLFYDTAADRGTIDISFLDPNADRASVQTHTEVKQENGAAPKAKVKKAGASTAVNQFKLKTREASADSHELTAPDVKEGSTKIRMSPVCFKHAADSLLELQLPDQKAATVRITCPKESILDATAGKVLPDQDIIRFGTVNATGEMAVDFIVPKDAGQKLDLESKDPSLNTNVGLSRGENFDHNARCRFANKFIQKIAASATIADEFQLYCYTGYPFIAVIPLANGVGELRYVISARLEDGTDDDEKGGVGGEGGEGGEQGEAQQEDVFMDEDEFSD